MNKTRKLASLLLALVMVLGMVGGAMAQETEKDTFTITINHSEAETKHTYEAYQIFTGDLSTNDNKKPVLSNIVWGSGISEAGKTALQNEYNVSSAAELAEKLSSEDDAKAFAAKVAQYLTSTCATSSASSNTSYTIEASAGYYLIKDKDDTLDNANDSYTRYMMKVVGDTTASHKGTVPSVDKEIIGGTTSETGDFDIGDNIQYKLTGTLPSNYADYQTYKYEFTDSLTEGLTYNNDAKVFVVNGENKIEVTNYFTISGTSELVISCDNLKVIPSEVVAISYSSKIVVEYTAQLNEKAVIGGKGNPNTVGLKFSNDPNFVGEGTPPTGDTPKDTVVVFTFELDVTKVDGEDTTKKLEGAQFKLKNEDAKWAIVSNGKLTGWADTQEAGSVLVSDDKGFFKVAGIEAGTYYLVETKAPEGYNLITDPITIVITSTYTEEAVTSLTIQVGNATVNGNVDTGIVETTVENLTGATLPETGGMGTTLLYIAGSILVVGAFVLMITKRRVSTEK